jgi:parallel beta-helix repeat protein
LAKIKITVLAFSLALIVALLAFPAMVSAASVNAAIVATSGQRISGNVDAIGKDIGIYVGPGVHDVTVMNATISGAGFEGILVQDARDIVIKNSTISGNGVNSNIPAPPVPSEFKGIVLAGTTDCTVKDNTVADNMHGGISVLDDGPNQPFAAAGPAVIPNIPASGERAARGNEVSNNLVKDNLGDCGIVVSGKNSALAGGGVYGTTVSHNTVIGFNPTAGDSIPGVGGIVLGAGFSAASKVIDTTVSHNAVSGGFLPGITLHCAFNGVISGTEISHNTLSNNGQGDLAGFPDDATSTAGITIVAEDFYGGSPLISNTQLFQDSVSGDTYAVWDYNSVGTTHSHVSGLFGPP